VDKPRRGQKYTTIGEERGKGEHGSSRLEEKTENHGCLLYNEGNTGIEELVGIHKDSARAEISKASSVGSISTTSRRDD
jgi:hypothetical protein